MNLYKAILKEFEAEDVTEWCVADTLVAAAKQFEDCLSDEQSLYLVEQFSEDDESVWIAEE